MKRRLTPIPRDGCLGVQMLAVVGEWATSTKPETAECRPRRSSWLPLSRSRASWQWIKLKRSPPPARLAEWRPAPTLCDPFYAANSLLSGLVGANWTIGAAIRTATTRNAIIGHLGRTERPLASPHRSSEQAHVSGIRDTTCVGVPVSPFSQPLPSHNPIWLNRSCIFGGRARPQSGLATS
jgi:hypothetical protein